MRGRDAANDHEYDNLNAQDSRERAITPLTPGETIDHHSVLHTLLPRGIATVTDCTGFARTSAYSSDDFHAEARGRGGEAVRSPRLRA
jgi:hypothetical protein